MTTLRWIIHLVTGSGGSGFSRDSIVNPECNAPPVDQLRTACRQQKAGGSWLCQLPTCRAFSRGILWLFLLLGFALPRGLEAQSWDLGSEFTSANPNGVWSYGWKSAPTASWGGDLSQYAGAQDLNGIGYFGWVLPEWSVPMVYGNTTGETLQLAEIDGEADGVVPAGTVFFGPGYSWSGQHYGVIRFTAPASGTYQIDTSAWPLYQVYFGDADLHIVKNSVLASWPINNPWDSVWDSRRVTLAQDETIDFVIGRGADDSESGSFLKIAATVTLIADGLSPGELHFQAPSIPASENSVLRVWASRQGGMAWPASVFYETVANGSAVPMTHFYGPISGFLHWDDGDPWSKYFDVIIGSVDANKTFDVVLSNPIGALMGQPSSATVTIHDTVSSTGIIQFSQVSYSVNEAGSTVTLTVTRTGGSDGAASVNYTTSNGSGSNPAEAGTDYVQTSGTVSWGHGQSGPRTFTVPIINDAVIEPSESFKVTLSGAGGAALGSFTVATVTILDNDTETNVFDVSHNLGPNPTGPWKYGWKSAINGNESSNAFHELLVRQTPDPYSDNGVPLISWQRSLYDYPCVFANATASHAVAGGGQAQLPPGTVWFVCGVNPYNYGVIRFTPPNAGNYTLETSVQPMYSGSYQGDTDFHIVKNGTELPGTGWFLGTTQSKSYTTNLSLTANEAVDFMIGRGADNNLWGSALKIQARLTYLGADTDGDTLPDSWEIANGLNHLVNDAADDPDGDDLTNLQEFNGGNNSTHPRDQWIVSWGTNGLFQGAAPANLNGIVSIDGGLAHTLALTSNGTVIAWGTNNLGQTQVPAGLNNVVRIAASAHHNLALKANGTVSAWGSWGFGSLTPSATVPQGLNNVVGIGAGISHDIALKNDGTVVVWGYTNEIQNTLLGGLSSITAAAAGWGQNLVLKSDKSVITWGVNGGGVGWNLTNPPASVTNVIAVAAGNYHSLALRTDGTVVAWGAGNGNDILFNHGQSIVPAGLSNVIAIAAGGYYSLALRSDSTVAGWGDLDEAPGGLTNVTAIGVADGRAHAVRSGRQTPVIFQHPKEQSCLAGGSVTFSVVAQGRASLQYQWQLNGVNIPGATSSSFTIANAGIANEGNYGVIVSNGAGSITSRSAFFSLARLPLISFATQPANQRLLYGDALALSIRVTNSDNCYSPFTVRWFKDGEFFFNVISNVPYVGDTNYTIPFVRGTNAGVYSVSVSNAAGMTNVTWPVSVAGEGTPVWWGNSMITYSNLPALADVIGLAAGRNHRVALREDSTVFVWGTNDVGLTNPPPGLSNVVAVAAGDDHALVLKEDGRVIAWGRNDLGQTNVPTSVTNAMAISAAGHQSLALRRDGTLVQWGQTNISLPNITDVAAIASGTNFHLALRSNGTVVAWGANTPATNVPSTLASVFAIAAGGGHALALHTNGSVTAWGTNTSGQATVPSSLTNIMGIATGYAHSFALSNNGTVVAWGDNTYGQQTAPAMREVKLIAAGGNQSIASSSAYLRYPLGDASRELLLIYNTNSLNSSNICRYYLENRPMVSNANVLGIDCMTNEFIETIALTNTIIAPVLNWFTSHPTKHPQYIILFSDVPTTPTTTNAGSVSYALRESIPGVKPYITHLHMGFTNRVIDCITLGETNCTLPPLVANLTNDCRAYIDKLASLGTNVSGGLILSASARGYSNTFYILDNIRNGGGAIIEDYSPWPDIPVPNATNGLIAAGVSLGQILYADGLETNAVGLPHPTKGTNIAGYITWGTHSSLATPFYALNPSFQWSGDSGWWIIETVESENGRRNSTFPVWFSANAWSGTNYSNTPVGAVTHVHEPFVPGVNDSAIYFGRWARGINFGIAAWQSRRTPYLQVVGDPLIVR